MNTDLMKEFLSRIQDLRDAIDILDEAVIVHGELATMEAAK